MQFDEKLSKVADCTNTVALRLLPIQEQILISLVQMVHFGWEQPLIIPDFGIFKICVFSAHPIALLMAS